LFGAALGYEPIMLALAAAVCFGLAAFGVHAGSVNLVWLGLAFLAGHFAYAVPILLAGSRR